MNLRRIFTQEGTISGNDELNALVGEVAEARNRYVSLAYRLTNRQAQYSPAATAWNAGEITEHLYRMEQSCLWGMWQAWQAYRDGKPIRTGEPLNQGLSIEEVVKRTWQAGEPSPANAIPHTGGTLEFWCASLLSLQLPLFTFSRQLRHNDCDALIALHPNLGPLDVWQQIDFLRFHIDHHRRQLGALFPHLEAER